MPDNQFRAQRSPSPKASPKALPPLSKFFYGPAPGRGSAEASPASYNASTWSVNAPHEQASAASLRRSPDLPPYSPTQWAKNYPSHPDPAQGWDDYVPPPSAPPAGQFIDSYALMHKNSHSSIDPTWDGNSPRASMDASRWSVNYETVPMEVQKPIPPAKPPLPPRVSQSQGQAQRRSSDNMRSSQVYQQSIYSSKQPPSSRVSATTIDVPLFLQPYAYDPETAPPLPRRPSNPPIWNQQNRAESPDSVPQPQRLPPPPPKIPLDQDNMSPKQPPSLQRPHYDPQDSLDGAGMHQNSPRAGQRQPRFDPQHSHENEAQHSGWQQRHSQPKIPTPQFSSFNLASALPPPSSQHSEMVTQNSHTSFTEQKEGSLDERHRAGSRLNQSSSFQNENNINDQWVSNHSRQDPQPSYIPSPEAQMATLAPRDGSITTTDGSSNRAGLSTPESQQTSNTSNHESVTKSENNSNKQDQPSNETFYWHSGRSDSDAEEDYGQGDSTTATPGHSSVGKGSSIATVSSTIRQASMSLPPRSTSKATTPNAVPYGASALGFGGPSDWEYFGDYEAEEVDDEELYTRSKHPAELPVEATTVGGRTSAQDEEVEDRGKEDDDEPPMFEIDPPPVPDRSPARDEAPVFPSRDDNTQAPKHATGDYSSVRLRMSSVQSPTRLNNSWNQNDRPISYYQRPDLDDVIRAWSEAPYIGVERSNDDHSRIAGEDDEVEVDKVPEASLASTPQDKFLGIDLILKDAPEMPKLPDSIDQTSPAFPSPSFGQQKFEKRPFSEYRKGENAGKPSIESNKGYSSRPISGGQQNAGGEESKRENKLFSTRNSVSQISEKKNLASSEMDYKQSLPTQRMEGSDTISGLSNLEHNGADHSSKSWDPSPNPATSSTQPSKGSRLPSVGDTAENLPVTPPSESNASAQTEGGQLQQGDGQGAPRTQSVVRNLEPRPQVSATSQESSLGKPNFTSRERPLTIRKTSREDVNTPSKHFQANSGTTEVSRQGSKESFRDANSTLSSHPPSQEKLNQASDRTSTKLDRQEISSQVGMQSQSQRGNPNDDSNNDHPKEIIHKISTRTPAPIKVTAIGPDDKPLQQDGSKSAGLNERPGTNSRPTSPKSPHSPKSVKVIDPYADLDPWGKASLNRFAAMLREEARVDSNKDKLNIFNVFTSRESRLRVVLYGTDDELILPSSPSEAQDPVQEFQQATTVHKEDPPTTDRPQSDEKAAVEPVKDDETSNIQQSGKLTADEEKAIEKKLASQMAAEENHVVDQKPPVPQSQKKKSFVQQAIERANSASTLKALPALPSNRDSVAGLPPGRLASLVIKDSPKENKQEAKSGDKSIAQDDFPSDDVQYSPGGRPIIPKLPENSSKEPATSIPRVADRKSKIFDGLSVEAENTSTIPEARPRPRPKPKDDDSEVKNYLTNRRSIYRPFATQTLETMESGSNFGRQPDLEIDSTPIPLLRAPSSKFNAAAQATQKVEDLPEVVSDLKTDVSTSQGPSDQRQFVQADFDPLLMVLPEGETKVCDSHGLKDLTDIMEAIPEDFSFIHASVVAWDANTRVQREANDKARHERQAESERRIDSLFDDHEIGYGDISELEAEFKRSEAARKADEDRNEYQTFVSDVFDLVWTRLHFELDQLKPHYDRYSVIMDETFAGKDMFEEGTDALSLASTMTQFLALHQKIEIRHQKAFEAVLERDRRLKKTEISPWYTLNNIPKVKQLEKQFEDAEKKAIIEYCEQRDGRANHLMDVLDQNTLRGVGANQDYMEAIMKAVRRIASGRAYDSVPGSEEEAAASLEEVNKAQRVTALLATSSEQIVQTFHVADMLLNSADYEVSVAKAKVARVDLATLAKLKEERAKEDQKLMRDLEHRLALIREDSRRTNDEIIKLKLFLGVNNERTAETAPRALGVHMRGGSLEASAALDMQAGPVNDPDHQERMRKALDEAKRRNEKKGSP